MVSPSTGKNGGVHLAREPKDITLWDICQAVETKDVDEIFTTCEGSSDCPVGQNFYQILYPHMKSAVDAMRMDSMLCLGAASQI